MNKKVLYYIAALLWGAPGVVIAVKGIQAYLTMPTERLWWLLLITAFVLMCFYLMFRKAVNKYSARIAGLPQKTTPWQTFPPGGWILIVGMACLGVSLKFIPGLPAEFIASFYSGSARCSSSRPADSYSNPLFPDVVRHLRWSDDGDLA